MKKKRITYGVPGMMEYQSVIRFGKNAMKVTFSGGSMNAIGVTPATFTTSNFLIQQAIENSSDYKRGRIRREREIELDEELQIERPKATVAPAEAPAGSKTSASASAQTEREETSLKLGAETKEGDAIQAEPTQAEAAGSGHSAEEPATQVEFSCNDDAKDYLEQTFGYVRSKLHNREDIVNAGKAHNVEITFV